MEDNKVVSTILDTALQAKQEKSTKGLAVYYTSQSNALLAFNTGKADIEPYYTNGVADGVTTFKGEKITLFDYIQNKFDYTASTATTLHLLHAIFTSVNTYHGKKSKAESINYKLSIPKDKILDLVGIPKTEASRKKARRQLNKDIEAIYNTSVELPSGTGFRILSSRNTNTSVLSVGFSPEYAEYLITGAITYFPPALLKVSKNNELAIELGAYLSRYYYSPANMKRGSNDIIKIKSILKECSNLPSVEKVDTKYNQDRKNKIIVPLEKALNELKKKNVLTSWEYRETKQTPYKKKNTCDNFNDFQMLCIVFHCKDSEPIEL